MGGLPTTYDRLPLGIYTSITHYECFETRSYIENAFCPATQSAFLFQAAKIIGAGRRYLNTLLPVMDLILGRITPRSYCYKATQRFRETFSLADAGGGPPRCQEDKATLTPAARGRADQGWEGRMDGPAVVPPISGQGCGSEPQSPKHMPHTLHKDKAHAEGEAGIAGDLLAPWPV